MRSIFNHCIKGTGFVKGAGVILLVLLGVAGLSVAGAAHAAKMYKYKDDNGRWVFTDKKPKNQEVQAQQLLVTEARTKANIVNRGSNQRPKLVAVNPMAGPVQVWVNFPSKRNMRLTAPAPHEWVVPGQSEQFVTALEKVNVDQSWYYEWQGQVVMGKPTQASKVKATGYAAPFKNGPFVISQGFMGTASHTSSVQAYYAVDIAMPKGTEVLAARGGVVMDVERDYSRSGWSQAYADEANYVRVLHEDDSMAVYAHLDADAIEVAIGQKVQRGTVLGRSGTTGYSTGPHLHFVIQINQGRELVSIPFEFDGGVVPRAGQLLVGQTQRRGRGRSTSP